MLTKNFYNMVMSSMTGKTVTDGFQMADGTYKNVAYNTSNKAFDIFYFSSSSDTSSGTAFGTGTTPSTPNDYKLENRIPSSSISITYPNGFDISMEEDKTSISATFALSNKSSEAISVSEVGTFTNGYYGTSSTSYANVLIDRTVLEEPITINRGETKQITYTIRMNYPTA